MYREWDLPSPLVRCAWSATVEVNGTWLQPATEFWGLGFSSTADGPTAELLGPAAAPQEMCLRAGDTSWGVEFAAHVFFRGVSKDAATQVMPLPVHESTFELAGFALTLPAPTELSTLVDDLRRRGLLTAEEQVAAALDGRVDRTVSTRTLRRRVHSTVGLNRQQVAVIVRARQAFALLSEGVPVAEVVVRAGYSDQAHLTRSLRTLAGRTPREILLTDR
ncbi:AraC family transcriptional regulator [Phycicoccus sp. BSK3Z-2]|uniref:AraC family transcriptional regulator n=1 Tax=Phycicoccus avicenniae TaxID=2828860 RepID=A0A941D930_9MICO|nr:helix-turn-helix domain-containing protein [Phycicoccus avicenniae]MBR7743756.1 AraC family transcriptional regulator [Phycicoccus avicenniae]